MEIKTNAQSRIDELKRIAKENNGLLSPKAVVDAARDEESPLHDSFTWDDTEAAENYRLWQARKLIRVTVERVQVGEETRSVNVWVSLTPDREVEGGGYREVVAVMKNKGRREQLLADALSELERVRVKYADLEELAEVFAAVALVRKKHQAD